MNTATESPTSSSPPLPSRSGSVFSNIDPFVVRLLIVMSMTFSLLPPGFNWGHTDPQGSYAEGSLIFQMEFGSVFLIGAWLAWRNRGWSLRHIVHLNPMLIAIILYCLLTIIWSPYPVVTLKRSIQLIGLTLVGIAISPPIGGKHQLIRTMLGTLMALMAVSFVVSLVLPRIGVDYELGGAWRGILTQKNTLGAISGLCVVLWIKESLGTTFPRSICYFGILFSLFMLVMAKSSTAILVATLGTGIYLLVRRRYLNGEFDGRRLTLTVIVVALVCLHMFYVAQGRLPEWNELFAPFGALFNKSTDLTGRTDIWRLVLLEVQRHPVFGIGYGAFWLGEGSPSQMIINALHWIPLQAHNGYLDILNELGIVGLVIMAGVFIFHILNLVKMTRIDREEAAIHWAMLILILISNLSESEMFRGVLFQNIFFIYSSTAISARITVHRMEKAEAARLAQAEAGATP
ncbi:MULTISPECIES: O-antigen ligase family protein [unclassified Herbaspirillum]|uniref:O-antigen ligase family protein n=1 Tax=unclassified Herbaspirillum TaxID=2624150 RepID=UPI000E2FA30F|nr:MULTISPECIES: O-antigen ligase family protein [unclassified Herbaspirillum]RFB73781.1 O-antigen ligase family protein [Herbaspirillum sp. 3R-3a1]TFI10408.1 O-antigen ligase family protein [Herbaspirillum sp. 3R11]TFI16313.1 O-antigen ligase family protein [Herbaspirillum sp. 3R-11]TFI25725.1 O-antigen ligase family protein [Herbaspirillum sp. 3C11]